MTHLRKSFRAGKMKSIESRLTQLKQLHLMITENEDQLYEAVKKDLNKVGGKTWQGLK